MAPVPLRLRRSAPPGRGRRCSDSIRRSGPECPRLPRETIQGQPPRDARCSTRAPHDAIASGVSVRVHPTGPAPIPHSQAAPRRAPRSASVTPLGSGRSRRAAPQRQTRLAARTPGQTRVQAVVLDPEITPHSLWKLWITRVCEPRALHASGSGDEVAAQLYAVAPGAPTTQTFGATSPTGGAVELGVHDYLLKPGPGESVYRMTPSALGRGCRRPGFTLIVGRDTRQNQAQPTLLTESGPPGF